jgi:His/Glu/Gln/Arg/opine family amino acid ABC transporter permease subunit
MTIAERRPGQPDLAERPEEARQVQVAVSTLAIGVSAVALAIGGPIILVLGAGIGGGDVLGTFASPLALIWLVAGVGVAGVALARERRVLAVSAAASAIGVPLVVAAVQGLVPYTRAVSAFMSTGSLVAMLLGVALGALAILGGFARYRRMPTRRAREQALAGAILGVEAVAVGLILLAFRTLGDPDRFVFHFFNVESLQGAGGVFLRGAVNTVILALVGELGGIVLGLILSLLALSKRVVVRAPARVYINFFRGTPLIWQLSVFYFGLSLGLGIQLELTVGPVQLSSAYVTAMVVFIFNTGGYAAEVFRAGIQSIERGQMEAARSLGMTYGQAMRYAIIPQAVRRVIPPLMNEFVILIKDTSLVVVLGLIPENYELFTTAREGYSDTFNATFFTAAALGYLVVTLPLIAAVNAVERRLHSGLVTVTT